MYKKESKEMSGPSMHKTAKISVLQTLKKEAADKMGRNLKKLKKKDESEAKHESDEKEINNKLKKLVELQNRLDKEE